MTIYFADSSAAAKRYVTEQGSIWVRGLANPSSGNTVIVSELAKVEIRKVLTSHYIDYKLSIRNMIALRKVFALHLTNEYYVIGVDSLLLDEAYTLIRKQALSGKFVLRSLDAIQLACALRAKNVINAPITFISGDRKLLQAARAEGFLTDNPDLHP